MLSAIHQLEYEIYDLIELERKQHMSLRQLELKQKQLNKKIKQKKNELAHQIKRETYEKEKLCEIKVLQKIQNLPNDIKNEIFKFIVCPFRHKKENIKDFIRFNCRFKIDGKPMKRCYSQISNSWFGIPCYRANKTKMFDYDLSVLDLRKIQKQNGVKGGRSKKEIYRTLMKIN
tara:strand:- start:713 stop:1234 length:522 start_codon:yes stop_codon:yes gene_type:complete